MIERHFAFKGEPFSLAYCDPEMFYRSRQHWLAESFLGYAIESRGPFALLTGEVGCGKSLLVSRLISRVGDDLTVGILNGSYRGLSSILPLVAQAFNLGQEDDAEGDIYERLRSVLQREYELGRRILLIIDEAQNLSAELLEELRLLSDRNTKETLLQILLVGQPELRETLRRPELRQFAQRISSHFHLATLSAPQTHAYIQCRLQLVGGDLALFATDAMDFVHAHTGGVPRLINQLCHYALVQATSTGRLRVDLDLMKSATQEFRGGFAFTFDRKPARAPEQAPPARHQQSGRASLPAVASRRVRASRVPGGVQQLPARFARMPARVQHIVRRPLIAAASLVAVAVLAGLVAWRIHQPHAGDGATSPVAGASYHAAPTATAPVFASLLRSTATASTVAVPFVAPAKIGIAPPVVTSAATSDKSKGIAATASVVVTPATPPAQASARIASARGTWLLNRAIDRLNAGDPAGAQHLMAQASAAGARPEDLADIKSGIDSQNLELRLMSAAEQIKADIASDALLDPAADDAEKRYQEMASLSPDDPLTLHARRDLQGALLAHVQSASRRGQVDVARRFLAAASRMGSSAEVTSAQEQLRDETNHADRQAPSPDAQGGEGSPRQMTAADPITAQTPAHRE